MLLRTYLFILVSLLTIALAREIPVEQRQSRQFNQNGNLQGGSQSGSAQQQQQQQVEEDEDEETSSPGPGALGVLAGLFGVFNGIGSLVSSGNPNKILESTVNFFPPHERDKAQLEINRLTGKTTKKPAVIYVTATLPPSAAVPTAAGAVSSAVVAQPQNPVPAAQAAAAAVAQASVTTVSPTATTGEDSEEEDYRVA